MKISDELRDMAQQKAKEAKKNREAFLDILPGDRAENAKKYDSIDFSKLDNRPEDDPECEKTVLQIFNLLYPESLFRERRPQGE
jgi:hypothetical protein